MDRAPAIGEKVYLIPKSILIDDLENWRNVIENVTVQQVRYSLSGNVYISNDVSFTTSKWYDKKYCFNTYKECLSYLRGIFRKYEFNHED